MTYDTFLQSVRKYTRGTIGYPELEQSIFETRCSGDIQDWQIADALRWGNYVETLVNPISNVAAYGLS
jgi:hypothetical protein